MSTTLLLAGVLLAQSAPLLTVTGFEGRDVRSEIAYLEVGHAELASDDSVAAIARIEANGALDVDDPAKLINLGTASARLGQLTQAAGYYRAAINSRSRYELELADGRWMDSRRAARLAMANMAKGEALAVR